ncbi:MAG: endonuclease/exonuclease/phosphatase family protein [Xanthomonadales bacterium]|nr:endonuclease/exonuclease/phosphatase family protein [Xanthomonadales bacterium]
MLALAATALGGCVSSGAPRVADPTVRPPDSIRVASFNAAMAGEGDGELISRLAIDFDAQAMAIGAILQRVRPDIVLINEFDHDPEGRSVRRFLTRYLARSLHGGQPIEYPYHYTAPVNTGMPSGLDLDGDGMVGGPGDAWGFGRFPGQYGMLVLSRFPIEGTAVRSFREFRWAEMPGALRPMDPATGKPFHPDAVWSQLRLSSKSHWDLPITLPNGRRLHLLAAHPTPPAFDGPEDRNGRRNHDEIRLWADYLDPARAGYLRDDAGLSGGLAADADFVIVGDYNADPSRGSSVPGAIQQLLEHPRVDARFVPQSAGAVAAQGGKARAWRDHAADTADFGDPVPGNLRVDYVLPSRGWTVLGGGVYWPAPGEVGAEQVKASDHRLVWLDLGTAGR